MPSSVKIAIEKEKKSTYSFPTIKSKSKWLFVLAAPNSGTATVVIVVFVQHIHWIGSMGSALFFHLHLNYKQCAVTLLNCFITGGASLKIWNLIDWSNRKQQENSKDARLRTHSGRHFDRGQSETYTKINKLASEMDFCEMRTEKNSKSIGPFSQNCRGQPMETNANRVRIHPKQKKQAQPSRICDECHTKFKEHDIKMLIMCATRSHFNSYQFMCAIHMHGIQRELSTCRWMPKSQFFDGIKPKVLQFHCQHRAVCACICLHTHHLSSSSLLSCFSHMRFAFESILIVR